MADNSSAFIPPLLCSTPLLNPVHPNSTFSELVSPCLANSLLPSTAAFFALFCAIFIFIDQKFFDQTANKPLVKSKLLWTKCIIPFFDLAASLLELSAIFAISSVPNGEEGAAREFHVQAIGNALFSLATILAYLECVKFGLISNGFLHLCWLFRLISILPNAILLLFPHNSSFNALLPTTLPTILHLLFASILVILLFYADKLAADGLENGYQRLEEEEMEFQGAKYPNPEATSSAAASLFYSYAAKMVGIGLRGALSYGQLWKLEKSNQSAVLRARFYANHGQLRPKQPKGEGSSAASNLDILKLFFGLLSSNWEFQLSSILLILFYSLCQWSNALFLRLVVEWVTVGNPIWLCAMALFGLFVANMIGKLCEVRSDMQSFLTSYNVRSILTMVIYDKMMRLSASAKKDYSCGEVNNLINTDVERIRICFFEFKYIFYCLLLGSISLIGLFHEIGPNALFGIGVILAMFPINFTFSWFQAKFEKIKMDLTDKRLKLCNDVLAGIKVLKLYAWEESMEKMISDIRKPEVTKICHLAIIQSIETVTFHITPILSTVLSFFGYTILQRRQLSPEIAFVSLLFFSMLQFCVYLLPMAVQATIKAFVSLGRVAAFLAKEEVERERIVCGAEEMEGNGGGGNEEQMIVSLRNCSFTWENVHQEKPPSKIQLHSISMELRAGELVGIVGKVGSGKSSLLSAILGEMYLSNLAEGQAQVLAKSIGYVPQQPWIQNKTLKANVLFDSPFLAGHYEEILEACALLADLKQLPASDLTEIGERGINLSGGQKARVALARAVYRHPHLELFILDDTLAAVDAHVAKHLFERVIGPRGLLRNKTRLFALNTLAYLPHFDRIIVLDEGKISAQGKYAELLKMSEGPFVELMREHIKSLKTQQKSSNGVDVPNEELDTILATLSGSPLGRSLEEHFLRESNENEKMDGMRGNSSEMHENGWPIKKDGRHHSMEGEEEEIPSKASQNANDGRLVEAEEMGIGQVSSKVYTDYGRAFGPALSIAFFFFLFTGSTIFGSLSSIWLAKWSSEAAKSNATVAENAWNLGIFGLLDAIWVILTAIAWIILSFGAYNASLHFHNRLIRSLFRSPMAFFDRTPTGRIQNRLSRDMESIDYEIPESLAGLLLFLAESLATLLSVCLVIPWLLFVAIPLLTIFIIVVRIYTKSAVQFRRLSATSWSHLCSFVQDTYLGADSIRAFNVLEHYRKLSTKVCDLTNECIMTDLTTNRWMQQRMNILGDFALFICMLIAMVLAANGTIPVGILAMIITAGANFTGYFGEIARAWRYAETKMVSVERIGGYIANEHEAEWTNAEKDELAAGNWPSHGRIQFQGVCLRYRADLDLVLNGLSFEVEGGEKIGIVGRTGAGKSSLTLALFRIIELCEGKILLDGIDISTLGLHKLRKALTIIPQDPVLFCGTLRSNLDPFRENEDAKLWTALEKAHLGELVQGNEDKLEMAIADNGSNLSVGQRQLVCLARALLRAETTRLLVLDEATAAIDPDTDARIQSTIRANFAHSTILTIAHRLNTILDYDRVLVMDRGQIAEFDTPAKLFHHPGSLFGQLARQAGISTIE